MPKTPLPGERAAYLEIADILRTRIASGTYDADNGKLPSGAELRDEFDVSQETLRKALDALKAEGRVASQQGRGIFAVTRKAQTRSAVERYNRQAWREGRSAGQVDMGPDAPQHGNDLNEVVEEAANAEVAEQLDVEVGTPVIARRRRNLEDDVPFQYAVSYLPMAVVGGTRAAQLDSGPGGSWARIEEAGWRFTRIVEDVEAIIPTFDQAKRLRSPASAPIFVIHRVAYGSKDAGDEIVLDYSVIELPGDRRTLRYELPVA